MEFNVFEYFKGYKRTTSGPMTPEEQGSSFFLAGHMGERIREHVDGYAAKAGLSRRGFLGTASGFAAVMLAVNKITGMRFFEVSEAEAYDPVAAKEITVTREPGADFIVDAHTHICTRKDGYIPGVNTTEKGMWFVQLLDDLGKAMGPAERDQGHDRRELREAHSRGERHERRRLQPLWFPRGLRRQGHDPDRGAGGGQAALAGPYRHAGRRPDAQPGSWGDAGSPPAVRGDVQDLGAQALHVRLDPRARLVVRRPEDGVPASGRSAGSSASRTSDATRASLSASSWPGTRIPRTSTRPPTTSAT